MRGRYRQTVDPGSAPGMTSLVVLPDTLLFVIPAQARIHPAQNGLEVIADCVGGLRGRYRQTVDPGSPPGMTSLVVQ